MLTELFLAGRYLKPRRSAVSLITVLSILGVTLGVAVLIVVLAVMTGFTDLMKEKLIETQAHFQVRPLYGGVIYDPDEAVKAVVGGRNRHADLRLLRLRVSARNHRERQQRRPEQSKKFFHRLILPYWINMTIISRNAPQHSRRKYARTFIIFDGKVKSFFIAPSFRIG